MQNASFFVCDVATGRILSKVKGSGDLNVVPKNNEQVLISCYNSDKPDDFYFDSKSRSVIEKIAFPDGELVNGEFTVSLPEGTTAVWQGQSYQVDDGSLTIVIDQPGTFYLFTNHPKFKDREYRIEN